MTVVREDDKDAVIIWEDGILWSAGTKAHRPLVIGPDSLRGGVVYRHEEAQVLEFAIDFVSDVRLPGHPP